MQGKCVELAFTATRCTAKPGSVAHGSSTMPAAGATARVAQCTWRRSRRQQRCVTRAALPEREDAPGPVEAVLWGGTLPSPRRAALGGLGALAITFGGNLGGATSWLLGLAPERAQALRLDALFPVAGYKRVVVTSSSYEMLIPQDWLADQTIARRKAALAELERGPLDPPSLRAAAARRSALPDSAYGPPGSTGEDNISVIVENANAFGVRFTLASMGSAKDVAERLLANVIARPGSGKTATLLDVQEVQNDSTALPVYRLEFTVRSETPAFERHNLSILYGSADGRLYTYTAQCSQADWAARGAQLRECAASFRVWV